MSGTAECRYTGEVIKRSGYEDTISRRKPGVFANPEERVNIVKWSKKDVFRDIEHAPNSVLDRMMLKGGVVCFGKRVTFTPEEKTALMKEINRRAFNGVFIATDRSERRAMRKHQPHLYI